MASPLDAVLVFPPPMDRIDRVYAAPHFLSTYLNRRGFRTAALDLNLGVLFQLATSYFPDPPASFPDVDVSAPAAVLAGRIKQFMGRVHICFGGPIITLLNREILNDMQDTLPVDSFVKYEGERPLARLIQLSAMHFLRLHQSSPGQEIPAQEDPGYFVRYRLLHGKRILQFQVSGRSHPPAPGSEDCPGDPGPGT